MTTVEEIDRKIVSLLARNGRMSFTELAKQAGLSVSAVHQRVRRLEQDGVIKGYVAVFDPDDVGPAADGLRLHQAVRRRRPR